MKILLIGNGAREHIIAEKLKASPQCEELIVYANKINPGIRDLAGIYHVGDLADMKALQSFADQNKPDFAVVGPEGPIADGAADVLALVGIPSVAPFKQLGQLESSKSFTRELLNKHKIPGNPSFKTFFSDEGLMEYALQLEQFVVKADGLQSGKGVQVMGDHFKTVKQGVDYAKKCIESDGKVVIEEKLVGEEFSLMSFADGDTIVDMPPIQDHKRAHEGDTGPNTGGMGTYSFPLNLPFLSDTDLKQAHTITTQVMAALKKETGLAYKGIMYGGFIAVKDGVRVIEYNARFGDPEAMNALTLLKTDLVDVCDAIIHGKLERTEIEFERKATVCKYVVPQGYPDKPKKGEHVKIKPLPEGVKMYYAAVDEDENGLVMTGSRALAFVGVGETIEEAEALAQAGVECVEGPVFYRKDIGTTELIQKRIDHMLALRNH